MGSAFTKGSKQGNASEAYSAEQAALARTQGRLSQEQADITRPLRTGTADLLSQFLKTGVTPSFLDLSPTVQPLAALSLSSLGSEQQVLKNSLLAQGNRGGQLQQLLAQASLQGGLDRAGLQQQDLLRQQQRDMDRSGIARTLFGGASDMGTGGLALAFQGLNSAMGGLGAGANNLNALGAQRIGQNQAAQQGWGQLLGKIAGAGIGGGFGGGAGALAGSRVGSGQAGGMK